ncbi:MAG: hypothetical protein EXR62_18435 [Chloroflexi bacterium]|nr:hypothetical protein [Chloroflexota bacterium]
MKKKRKAILAPAKKLAASTGHVYSEGWESGSWLVPFQTDGNALIHHGHDNPDDHSQCGPTLFCCQKAAGLFIGAFPDVPESRAKWEATPAFHVISWMESGVNAMYFIFCDPERPRGLRAIGLLGKAAREVVLGQAVLERYLEHTQQVF